MPSTPATEPEKMSRNYRLLAVLLLLPALAALASTWLLDHAKTHKSLFTTTNMVGPTTQSLLRGNGLTLCTEDMGTLGNPICFHASHMPVLAMTVALGIRLLGDRYLPVAFFKTVLLLLPVGVAIVLVWRRLPRSRWRRAAIVLLLLAPFAIPASLADVANMLVEEGYSYSFLTLAAALLFFGQWNPPAPKAWAHALLFAIALDGLYLSKSAMLPAVIVLAAGFLLLQRRASPRLLVIALVAAAPLGWAVYQHHASGRYTIGTSLDGINLHKGNNAEFLANYPPLPGDSLDHLDPALNHGLHFTDEWSFNNYHRQAALNYLRTHPRETLQGDARKLFVLFFSVQKYGSTATHGAARWIEEIGMAVFRLMLWAAIGCSVSVLLRPANKASPALRVCSGIFLALVAACAAPYLAGFAYTRHISILIYPAALMCCRMLAEDHRSHEYRASGERSRELQQSPKLQQNPGITLTPAAE